MLGSLIEHLFVTCFEVGMLFAINKVRDKKLDCKKYRRNEQKDANLSKRRLFGHLFREKDVKT